MNYSKYTRSFIILDDKKSDFRNTNENIKGHIKLELRHNQGSIRCIVQNLKYYDDARYLYRLYFFGKKDDKTIFSNAGTLYVSKQGKGEHSLRFNPLDLDGEGNELNDFSIIAVVAQPNKDVINDDQIYPVLTGYLSKDSSQSTDDEDHLIHIHQKDDELQNQEADEEINAEEQVESTENASPSVKEASEISGSEKKESIEEQSDLIEEQTHTEESKVPKETRESVQAASAESTMDKSINQGEQLKPPYKNISPNEKQVHSNAFMAKKAYDTSSHFSNYMKTVSHNLEKILSFHNKSEPFEKDKIGCSWWKIMNLMSIPFANTSYLQGYPEYIRPYNTLSGFDPKKFYPSCHDLIYKYQHYIFGIEKNERNQAKYYYYGIPGRYMKEEQPDNGQTGFEYWQPLQGNEKRKGDYGYWIVAINAQTGQFEIPIEK